MMCLTRSTHVTRRAASSTRPIEAGSCRGWRPKHDAARHRRSRRHQYRQGSARNAPAEAGSHGSAHYDDCERPNTCATYARTEAAERAAADAVVRSRPAAAAHRDAVSDTVCRVDELPED